MERFVNGKRALLVKRWNDRGKSQLVECSQSGPIHASQHVNPIGQPVFLDELLQPLRDRHDSGEDQVKAILTVILSQAVEGPHENLMVLVWPKCGRVEQVWPHQSRRFQATGLL